VVRTSQALSSQEFGEVKRNGENIGEEKMNRIIIIGNGFDLAHGLKTSYKDFLEWVKSQIEKKLDEYFEPISLPPHPSYFGTSRKASDHFKGKKLDEFIDDPKCKFTQNHKFLEHIIKTQNLKNWVDIEEEYFKELNKRFQDYVENKSTNIDSLTKLNQDFTHIEGYLKEYLCGENEKIIENLKDSIKNLKNNMIKQFDKKDKVYDTSTKLDNILLLNFNYTSSEKDYEIPFTQPPNGSSYVEPYTQTIHIHGELKDENNPIIFGYGNENTEIYKEIEKINRNEFLENMKSFKYSNVSKYNDLMLFVKSAKYQIYIWGHSCGNSDGTLLKELFENDNCVSIKPFYYIKENGSDDYSDIAMNISRHFSNNTVFREKIINKEYCEELKIEDRISEAVSAQHQEK
jgi:hypothetical protein